MNTRLYTLGVLCFVIMMNSCSSYMYTYSSKINGICSKKGISIKLLVVEEIGGARTMIKAREKGLECVSFNDWGGEFYQGGENFSLKASTEYKIIAYPQGSRRSYMRLQLDSMGEISPAVRD